MNCRNLRNPAASLFCIYTIFLLAKGSRFTFGGLGVDPCSRDPASGVRNRSQPSVCGHSGLKVALPVEKVAKTWLFWRVRRCGHVVLRGRRGTSWQRLKLPCLWEKSQKSGCGSVLLTRLEWRRGKYFAVECTSLHDVDMHPVQVLETCNHGLQLSRQDARKK